MKRRPISTAVLTLLLCVSPLVLKANETPLAPTSTPTPTATPCSSPGAVFTQDFDDLTPPALPAGWVATNAIDPDAILWTSSNSGTPLPPSDSLPNSAATNDPATISDKRLESPIIPIWNPSAQLTFRNNFNLEATFDGGVLEVSVNGGAFADILTAGGSFVTGGYTATISTIFSNPIGGRTAWSGNSGGFRTTTVNLPGSAAGGTVKLRWRMASDTSVSAQGWRIDNVVILDCPQPVTVSLPIDSFDTSVPSSTVIIEPVVTTLIHPTLDYTGFQCEFTFDSAVVSFASVSQLAQPAGLTANGWTVGSNVLNSGPGTIKTVRISALSNDGITPLNGSGTLFNLRMIRVSGSPGTMSPLIWRPYPDDFEFIDGDLNTHSPNQNNGLITITGMPVPTPSPTPSPTPTPTPPPPTPSPTPGPTVKVSLPTDSFDNSVPISTVIIEPVVTTFIAPSLDYTGFQAEFTFDSAVVSFASVSQPAQPAGLTANGWTVGSNVLNSGPGTIKTVRISALSNDGITPLNGSGTLFNLRMVRVSGTPGATSPLIWRPYPDDFEFIDGDLNTVSPNQNNGLITITGMPVPTPTPTPSPNPTPTPTPTPSPTPSFTPPPPVTVSLPTDSFDTSVPLSTVIVEPVTTTLISPVLDYTGFQAEFTFDSAVVSFASVSQPAQPAGLTANGWTVGSNVLNSGPGTIKTVRISALSNDGVTPLNGSGTLFNLRMVRVSGTPGATSSLAWRPSPDDFEFIDADLTTHSPAQNNGLITITGPAPTPSPTPQPINISGLTRYCPSASSHPVPGVMLTLTGSASGSALSDGSGAYAFSSLPGGGSYAVTPSKAAVAPGTASINIADVIAVQRHFLAVQPLSGCRLKAADVNRDNAINNVDITALLRFYLGYPTGIANVGKYQFVPASRTYSNATTNQTGQDFDVLVLGDVAAPFVE